MKIVYVIEQLSIIGGIERILTYKMNYLAENTAHEIILILVWRDDKPIAFPLSDKIRIIRLNVPQIKGGAGELWALHRYNKCIQRIKPDITDLVWVFGAFVGAFGKHVGKTIYELHLAATKIKHGWLNKIMQRRVDSVVTLTSADAAYFTKAKRVEVIPNFTLMRFPSPPDYNNKVIVCVGRVDYQKNFPRLYSLWDKISPSHPDWQLRLHHDTIDIESAYLEGSIYVMTSRYEGFGMVLIEAMTCGLPCVAFDCPNGPRDIIEDGKTGYLIPYDDDAMFIEKLTYLMKHPKERERMGKAAKERVKRFDVEAIMQKWEDLYSELKGS